MKRSVRESALSVPSCNSESSRDSHSDEGSEHFFVPLSVSGFSRLVGENKRPSARSKRLFASQTESSLHEKHASDDHVRSKYDDIPDVLDDLDSFNEYDQVNGFLSAGGSNSVASAHQSFFDIEDTQDQVFSPPLLIDTSLLEDAYEDLLGMLICP